MEGCSREGHEITAEQRTDRLLRSSFVIGSKTIVHYDRGHPQ